MKAALRIGILGAALFVVAMLIWQGVTAQGAPDPMRPNTSPTVAFLDIGILVFREGLECILVLAAITASMVGAKRSHRRPVALGAGLGVTLTGMVAVLTFVLQQRLPYRKMLITTGILLGVVLLVMVGEQAQEMQLAHWIPTTPISQLENVIPAWVGMWFAVFPTVETLVAQLIAAVLVIGSYYAARQFGGAQPKSAEPVEEARAEADAAIVESLGSVAEQQPNQRTTEPSAVNAARSVPDETDSRQQTSGIVITGRA